MFEFKSMEPRTLSYKGEELSRSTVARLQILAGIAEKLQKAGWKVWMTMTGLAFEPRKLIDREDDLYSDEVTAEVADALAQFGIKEEFSPLVGKRVNELPDGMANWMWDI